MEEEKIILDIAVHSGFETVNTPKLNREWLAFQINELINNDFSKLISILYRIDVDEHKLKALLEKKTGIDSGMVIADLLIERQIQIIRSRESFKKDHGKDHKEKW